jgi:hypothetical protein
LTAPSCRPADWPPTPSSPADGRRATRTNAAYGPLRANELIIIDIFPRSQKTGYFGDITRTVVRGRASEAARKLYDTVYQGQKIAFRKIRANAPTGDAHRAVQDFFEQQGYKTRRHHGRMEGFFHGTGHGLGLEIHESPRVGATSTGILKPGHVVTVEPGLYYPEIGGVRLEDVALVTNNGARNLTRFEKVLEILLLIGLVAIATGCGNDKVKSIDDIPSGISWASILSKASDLQTLAEPVSSSASAKMFSSSLSTNKVMLANLAPQIIGDIDYGFFSEITEGKDGIRATLAEFNGPGVVTWVWSANPIGTLNLYVDNQDHPVLTMPFAEFLGGRFLPVQGPFSSETALGHNLNFPIVHAKHCKLVVTAPRRSDLSELYYQVAWQSLPTGVEIHPFDVAAIKQQSGLLKALGRRLRVISKSCEPASVDATTFKRIEYSIQPGQSLELFRAKGPQAIAAIRFIGKSKSDLNGLWIKGVWDGEVCVQSPLHVLAGVSSDMEDTESFPATVDGSQLVLRWFMPFATEGQVLKMGAFPIPSLGKWHRRNGLVNVGHLVFDKS